MGMRVSCKVEVIDKETGKVVQSTETPCDLGTLQLAQIMCANMLNSGFGSAAIYDTSGTQRAFSANTAITGVNVVAGTGSGAESTGHATAAAVTDYALGAIVSGGQGTQAATIAPPSGWSGSSGTFTITANMNAPGSNMIYYEVGIYITTASYTFMIAHNVNTSGWSVSTTQYLAVTFTQTIS
jgi:hypothetical protein